MNDGTKNMGMGMDDMQQGQVATCPCISSQHIDMIDFGLKSNQKRTRFLIL
jgi:hypothetical protein